jgi:hypothetical protein
MEILYPFSSDPVLREHYRNPWNAVRVGRLMEDMDSLAGVVAYDHWYVLVVTYWSLQKIMLVCMCSFLGWQTVFLLLC